MYAALYAAQQTLYSRVNTQGESHCGRLSGDQEDKLDWKRVTNTEECTPEWGPRGQVGFTQDATGGFIYTTAHSICYDRIHKTLTHRL